MPKRNYGFEKRQKEANRQRKREEKEQRKLDRASARDAERDPPPGLPLPPGDEPEVI